MSKPSPKVKKVFSLVSICGAMLKASCNGNPKLLTLQHQINRAMKVFSVKSPKTIGL